MMNQTKRVLLNLDLDKIKPANFQTVCTNNFSTLEQAIIDATADNIDVTYDSLMESTRFGEYKDDYPDACIFYEHLYALRLDMEKQGIKFIDGLKACIKNFLASGAENHALVLKVATLLTDLCNGAYKLHNSIELGFAIEARACLFMLGCVSTKDSGFLVYDHASFIQEILEAHQGFGVGSWTPLTTISAVCQGVIYDINSKYDANHYHAYMDFDLISLTMQHIVERDSEYDGVQYVSVFVLEP